MLPSGLGWCNHTEAPPSMVSFTKMWLSSFRISKSVFFKQPVKTPGSAGFCWLLKNIGVEHVLQKRTYIVVQLENPFRG